MSTVQHSRLLQTYFYEVNTRGKRGAAARTAAVHRVSRQWVERLAKRHAKEAERIPVVPVAPVLPVPQLQPVYDPLLVELVLSPVRCDIITTRRRSPEMRRCVLMVLYATMITVCCCVLLPPAALVVVPSWGLLLRELNTALEWERGSR